MRPSLASFEDETVFMSGGFNPRIKGATTSVDMYSVSKNQWTGGPAMNFARIGHSMCATVDGHLYSVGGYDGSTLFYSQVERLDVRSLLDKRRSKTEWHVL